MDRRPACAGHKKTSHGEVAYVLTMLIAVPALRRRLICAPSDEEYKPSPMTCTKTPLVMKTLNINIRETDSRVIKIL